MNITIRAILAILACYRLARFLTIDEGPFGIFDWLRDWAGVNRRITYNALTENEYNEPSSETGKLFDCPHCIGVWCAVFLAMLVVCPTTAGDVLLVWLAISGGQSWLASH